MKVIVLDRDGVINEDSDQYIKSPEEWIPIAGSLEAIARLNQAGFVVVVATNQSGIARGYFNALSLQRMHDKMYRLLAVMGAKVDAIFYCPHGPEDDCECRKPRSGLFKKIQRSLLCNLDESFAIGDSYRDIQAAQHVGAQAILVKTGKGAQTLSKHAHELTVPVFDNLAKAVDSILKTR